MTNLWYFSLIVIFISLGSSTVVGKPILLACDTYATTSTCSRTPTEGNSECDTCCNMLLERMFNCPPCRYFVLNNRRQGSSCFCTICFKQNRHRRRHHLQENEQLPSSRFDG
ncbi:unnamed protein product [Rotaria socialis]|uniref:Uncharacterized protein n=1 Tax=Rotaria socialis TaxID=392032 RepID=A0A821LDA2_9BILA|nr:unnamed protein product [Rotaria socialis]CAF3403282.1 unnamed protein product [Rotaria socialis]CAF3416754.1 unnamed protein product [Rotaria socialis]CAF3436567.1 unnamed protein product [Rotaria socialis]CAF3685462.1 unnamed protein product [Rotaria socialis]